MEKKIAILGECMLELSSLAAAQNLAEAKNGSAKSFSMFYGGDTLNTAVYMARLGVKVDYITALGSDNLSYWMKDQWLNEGVGCQQVQHLEQSNPGLYMIETDAEGERYFTYWREQSAARQLFNDQERFQALLDSLSDYDCLYYSGITLALMSQDCRERFFSTIEALKSTGKVIAFDPNYRIKLWPSAELAKSVFTRAYRLASIALPSFEDEHILFGDVTTDETISRIKALGVGEIVLKLSADGCFVDIAGACEHIKSQPVNVVNATAAGDSFNAAYLAARSRGQVPKESALQGHQLAATVIQHHGAIISQSAMPKVAQG